MKASSKYKRFKRINFASNTYTLLDMRSSIIRTIQGYHSHANTANLRRSEKQAQSARGVKNLKTYLIFEMLPILVYYSYERKYYKLTSMFIPGYQCPNVYINVEKSASMNKDIQ